MTARALNVLGLTLVLLGLGVSWGAMLMGLPEVVMWSGSVGGLVGAVFLFGVDDGR